MNFGKQGFSWLLTLCFEFPQKLEYYIFLCSSVILFPLFVEEELFDFSRLLTVFFLGNKFIVFQKMLSWTHWMWEVLKIKLMIPRLLNFYRNISTNWFSYVIILSTMLPSNWNSWWDFQLVIEIFNSLLMINVTGFTGI